MSARKKDRWIGTAQVFIDVSGYARAVLIHEDGRRYRLIGPIGCTGEGVDEMKDRTGTESGLKQKIEKELRDAGY
jgi:hypothetical protein